MLDKDALQALPEDGDVSSHFTSVQYIPSDESMQNAKKKEAWNWKMFKFSFTLFGAVKMKNIKKN